MTILPTVWVSDIPNGRAAHAVAIKLAAHGDTDDEAVQRLARIVEMWARALARGGLAERALQRLGVEWTADGEGIVVQPRVTAIPN